MIWQLYFEVIYHYPDQTTTTDYGYLCERKYMDFIYLVAIEVGLIEGDILAKLASFHPDFINAVINFKFVCDHMVKITLSDGTVIELPQFQFFPRFTSFYEPSGS